MSGLIGSAIPGDVLAWLDGPPGGKYDPETERQLVERHKRAIAESEVERKKLCEELLAKKPADSWDSFVKKLRIWYNDCSKPEAENK